MALIGNFDSLKHVPWLSPTEWHQVYKGIYSQYHEDQITAYETLLAWKARLPKLPVGVECTLTILQVCIKDREWMPKITRGELPVHYENDLCLMYSTNIMRLLNHISNIGQTKQSKQSSLFRIASDLKIPEWIVNLRHDVAHGFELPTIDLMRVAVNILLKWLHGEYWAPEAKAIQEYYTKEIEVIEKEESEEIEAFTDLLELWTAVNLYIFAKYTLVSEIPDEELRTTLKELRAYSLESNRTNSSQNNLPPDESSSKIDNKYTLTHAKHILISELSRYLGKIKRVSVKELTIPQILIENDTFLPNSEVCSILIPEEDISSRKLKELPPNIVKFWQDIMVLLQERKMLEPLIFKLLEFVQNEKNNENKKFIAALWIHCIVKSFLKLSAIQRIVQSLEYKRGGMKIPISKYMNEKLNEKVEASQPGWKNSFSFSLSTIIPSCLTDLKLVTDILMNPNEFTIYFIAPWFHLVRPQIDSTKQLELLRLLATYSHGIGMNESDIQDTDKIFTVEDIEKTLDLYGSKKWLSKYYNHGPKLQSKSKTLNIADKEIRNTNWKLASDNHVWGGCPIGLLPWQVDSLETLEPPEISPAVIHGSSCNDSNVLPGIIDNNDLKVQSRINWDKILGRRKLKYKSQRSNTTTITNRAIKTVKRLK